MPGGPDALAEPLPSSDGEDHERLRDRVAQLERRVQDEEEHRRALLHIMGDLNESNRRLATQRKAMIHILGDYEKDRRRLAGQTERLDNSRRALLNILKDSHHSNLRLEDSRKAMIHIMGDLRDTTAVMERRELELRDKQEQLVQAGKLATLGELTTGVAHELNNPLNNIGLFVGNVLDQLGAGELDEARLRRDLEKVVEQVEKATEIITHLRTFGRAAPVDLERVPVQDVIERALSLLQEQLRLRQIRLELDLCSDDPAVLGNPIQLEQVFINLLTNARDALEQVKRRTITIKSELAGDFVRIAFRDNGPGIPEGLEQRIFDPFFTTKEVGSGTGLGLSIAYGIVKEHGGTIYVETPSRKGGCFLVELPLAGAEGPEEASR